MSGKLSDADKVNAAVLFHNRLWDVEWPEMDDLVTLASHTRMVLGDLETLKVASKETYHMVIHEALIKAYMLGMDPPPAPELTPAQMERAHNYVMLGLERARLTFALKRALGVKRTETSPADRGIVLTCSSCWEDKFVPYWDDSDIRGRMLASARNAFAYRHGECDGVS